MSSTNIGSYEPKIAPPTYRSCPMPTPPLIITAPVTVLVEDAVPVNLTELAA